MLICINTQQQSFIISLITDSVLRRILLTAATVVWPVRCQSDLHITTARASAVGPAQK